jgi:hypothetical protein
MSQLIHEHTARIRSQDGAEYRVRTYADARRDGTWAGWLEFIPTQPQGTVLRTEQETSQPDRAAVEYWAAGLERVYLEGAFGRAQRAGFAARRPLAVETGPRR